MSTFKPALPFFTISYSPDTDDISSPIIPSKAELFLIREVGDTALQTLLNDMLQHQNDEFFMTIEQDTGSGYEPFWNGIILQDQIEEIEGSLPYEVKITATDGLNLLKSKDADFTNDDTVIKPLSMSLRNLFYKCLEKMPHLDSYESTDPFMITDAQVWEDSQTYSATGEPLDTIQVDVRTFKTIKENASGVNETTFKSAYDVISEMAKAFLYRVYQSEGAYRMESIPNKENSSTKTIKYNVSNTLLTTTTNSTFSISNNSFGSYVGRDNLRLKLPALKQVTITSATGSDTSQTRKFANRIVTPVTVDFGVTDTTEKLAIRVFFGGSVLANVLATNGIVIRHDIDFTLTSASINSSNVYYWDNSNKVWTTNATSFKMKSSTSKVLFFTSGATQRFDVVLADANVYPSPVPEAGDLELDIAYNGLEGRDFGVTASSAFYPLDSTPSKITSYTDSSFIYVSFAGSDLNDDDVVQIFSSTNDNIDINDKEIFDYGEIEFGDASLQTGRLYIKETSTKTKASNWSFKNESQNLRLLKLLANERLALQSRPIRIYDGTLGHIQGYHKVINKDSQNLLPMDVTFNAFDANYQGRWYEIQKNTSNISAKDILNSKDLIGDTLKDGRFLGDGFVSRDLIVQGDGTGGGMLGDGLYYDGQNEEQVAVAKFDLDKGFKATINTLTYTATGQSQPITEEMHLVHIDTTGENFDVDATLPASADVQGQEFIVITDKDNHNGSVITLVPQAGDTINNDTDYDLQHASDKVVLRVIGTNYYVE